MFRRSIKRTERRALAAGAAVAVAVALAACAADGGGAAAPSSSSSSSSPDKVVTVKYGVTSKSISSLPTIIGDAKGYFADEGIALETVVTGQSGKVCQQLIARAIDLGECSTSDVVRSVAAGGPIKVRFFTSKSVLPNKVYVDRGITSWKQLAGKTVMVASQQDNTFYFTKLMAKHGGLKFPDDVTVTYAGSSTDRFAALSSGTVQATILTVPYDYLADKAGYHELDDLVDQLPPAKYFGNGVASTNDYAKKNPQVIKKVYAAEEKALKYMLNPSNKADVLTTIKEVGQLSGPTADDQAKYIYSRLIASGYYFAGGTANEGGIQGIIDSTVALGFVPKGAVKPSAIYDTSIVSK